MLGAALCLCLSAVAPGPGLEFALVCAGSALLGAAQPVFWLLPSRFLAGVGAATGIAAINSFGNLGGFVAQTAMPAVHDATKSNLAPIAFVGASLALTGAIAMALARRPRLAPSDPA